MNPHAASWRTGLACSKSCALGALAPEMLIISSPSSRAGCKGLGRGMKQKLGEEGFLPLRAPSLSFPPSHSLQPASPLCSDHRTRPSPCESSLAAMPLPCAPLGPQRPFHHASAPRPAPPPRPTCAEPVASCQGPGLPEEAETEISPPGRFSSARRAWGLCLAPRSSPHASSR